VWSFAIYLKRLRAKLKSSIYRAAIAAFIVVVYGTFSEYYIENPIPSSGIHSMFNSLWWVMQTVTTVGYGDTPVIGFLGRVNAIIVMIFGIGSLGFFTASFAANIVDMQLAKRFGEVKLKMKDHVIICNSDERIADIIREVNASGLEVAIIDQEDPKVAGGNYFFIKGNPMEPADLVKAGIEKSFKVVILPGKSFSDPSSVDAKSILTSMIIKNINREAYIIVELLKSENSEHARMAGASEVVIKGSMSSLLVSNAVIAPGVSKLFYELLSGEDGYRIREYRVDESMKGKMAGEFYDIQEKDGRVVLGFRNGGRIDLRPSKDSKIGWDYFIVMERR
jgi:voltage-gated potassium channel